MNALSLLSLAIAPGAAIILYVYLKDKHEREPLTLLLISFFYGCLSTLITLIVSIPVNSLVFTKEDDLVEQFFNAFLRLRSWRNLASLFLYALSSIIIKISTSRLTALYMP